MYHVGRVINPGIVQKALVCEARSNAYLCVVHGEMGAQSQR